MRKIIAVISTLFVMTSMSLQAKEEITITKPVTYTIKQLETQLLQSNKTLKQLDSEIKVIDTQYENAQKQYEQLKKDIEEFKNKANLSDDKQKEQYKQIQLQQINTETTLETIQYNKTQTQTIKKSNETLLINQLRFLYMDYQTTTKQIEYIQKQEQALLKELKIQELKKKLGLSKYTDIINLKIQIEETQQQKEEQEQTKEQYKSEITDLAGLTKKEQYEIDTKSIISIQATTITLETLQQKHIEKSTTQQQFKDQIKIKETYQEKIKTQLGETEIEYKQANAEIEKLKIQQEQEQIKAESEIEKKYNTYKKYQIEIIKTENIKKATNEQLLKNQLLYKKGMISKIQLEKTEMQKLQAELSNYNANINCTKALILLDQVEKGIL